MIDLVLLAFIIGITISNSILSISFFSILVIFQQKISLTRFKIVLLLTLITFVYLYVHQYNTNLENSNSIDYSDKFSIQVHDDLNFTNEYNISFIGKIDRNKYLISIPKKNDLLNLKYGDIILTDTYDIKPITNKFNNPSSFDYQKYMKQKKIIYKITIKKLEYEPVNNLNYLINNFRLKVVGYININKPILAPYINTLVFGENQIDNDIKKIYSNVGITHALTISGTHILLLLTFYKWTLRHFNIYEKNIEKSLFILLPIYTLLTGAQIPILRAVIVELIYMLFQKKYARIYILKLLCLLNIIYNPNILFNISFILSYIISYFIYFIEEFDFNNNKLINYFKPSFLIMLLIFPILCNLSYEFNFSSFICSIILTPIITLILLPLSFIVLIFSDASLFAILYLKIISFIEMVAIFFDNFTLTTGLIKTSYIFIYYLIYITYYFKKNIIYLMILVLLIFTSFINMNLVGSVSIIDAGQGDAILIEFPLNRGNILIDTGPESSKYELVKYLKYMGIDKIDHLFITHWHNDHYGGNELLFSSFDVDNVYSFASNSTPDNYQNITFIKAGDTIEINNVEIMILSPFKTDDNLNNESLTLLMELGGKKWLFTGDIEAEVEAQIIEKFKHIIDIDYLKVPHHGSKTSSSEAFLKYTTPSTALISVGENNKFKHPSIEVINRYESLDIHLYQTKDVGIIRFNFFYKYIWYNK